MNALKHFRNRKNMSQGELAECTGLSQSYISRLEREIKDNPSKRSLEVLAAVLECSVDDLLAEKPA